MRGFGGRPVSLGSGSVTSHHDRPIVHFGSPPQEVDHADRLARLREQGFEIAERMPS